MTEWIDAKENPPPEKEGTKIIVTSINFYGYEFDKILKYVKDRWIISGGSYSYSQFDYWMPWNPPEIPNKSYQETEEEELKRLRLIEKEYVRMSNKND